MRMERLALGIALLTTTAQGQETARVSVDSLGAQANDVIYH